MEVIDAIKVPAHGGSIRVSVKKKNGTHEIRQSVNTMILDEQSSGMKHYRFIESLESKISDIRGVDSDSSIKTLNSRGLIAKSGELEVPGSPVLYVTTELFNEKMDIGSIDELPRIGSLFTNEEE